MRGTKAMKATAACMLRLVPGSGGCRASTAQPAASVSLLERIRDVVLRLIMLSAVSRASVQRNTKSGKAKASSPRAGWQRYSDASVAEACRRDDSIRNEAVEDCIEFLKRSSADGDAAKMSSVSVSAAEGVAADACTAKMWCVTASDAKLSGAGSEEEMATFVVVDFEARREASPGA
ncbi:uncharacterized protein LOC133902893 [Phragmites australis]|uniref:uncharacterized protein LOC133902893 n=1 Tax=Phragmites australis TaxID=29695 RepID=UPI002D76647D|nr:uncharacterized protein LOC133902893 [Phragmites australis]